MTIAPRNDEESGRMRYGGAVDEDDGLHKGDVVGGGAYRIEGVLGRGGMATVYIARRERDGVEIALKVLDEKHAKRSDVGYRLRNEVELAAELSGHPNLVRPLEGGRLPECNDAPYLVTELVRGPVLAAVVIMERPLAALRACRIALDVARALAALHARGIVHRDVKPDNVIVAREDGGREVAKLIDFGLAARIRGPQVQSSRVTEVFERPGTKHYMAPEQASGAEASSSMDVYALGITLYEMLVGSTPYGQRSEAEVVARKLATGEPSFSIAGERDELPASLVAIVDACLVREAHERISIDALCVRLAEVVEELGGPTNTVGAVAPARPSDPGSSGVAPGVAATPAAVVASPPPRSWRWLAVVGLLVATAGIAWAIGRMDRDTTELSPAPTNVPSAVPQPAAIAPAQVGTPQPPQRPPQDPEPAPTPATSATSIPATSATSTPAPSEDATAPQPKRKIKTTASPLVARDSAHVDEAACTSLRAATDEAVKAFDWPAVLEKTASKRCWPSAPERLRPRVRALSALGRHDDCVREGKGSTDERVARITELCRRKLETP